MQSKHNLILLIGFYLLNRKESKVRLHPTSALLAAPEDCGVGAGKKVSSARNRSSVSQIPTDWFIFDEMLR